MKTNKKFALAGVLLAGIILSLCLISAYQKTNNAQYSQYSFGTGYTKSSLELTGCGDNQQDFLIQVAPFGCEPAVVRSDLLEEQNVPVFCQLAATKINPLIDVKAIESLSFSGDYPPEIASVGFQPVRAALGTDHDLNQPTILDNIGYAVIILKKQPNASSLPEEVTGTLKAKMQYDIENAFGIGRAGFYLPVLTDEEWTDKQAQYSFWNGKGHLRLNSLTNDRASVSVYDGANNRVSTVNLEKGKNSESVFLPGFDCMASLQLRLDGAEVPKTTAQLRVGDDVLELAKGEKFLNNKCTLLNIEKIGLLQKATIQCKEDSSEGYTQGKAFSLIVNPQVVLNIEVTIRNRYKELIEKLELEEKIKQKEAASKKK
jgi:hypothetical protein